MEQRAFPEINPHKWSQLIFDKGERAIQWSKNSLSTNGARMSAYPHSKKNESRHRIYTLHNN